MDVVELFELAKWYRLYFKPMRERYSALHAALSNNASQPAQQPIEEPLQNLTSFLSDMHLGELSLQQLRLLDELGIETLIGMPGAEYVEATVKTASYDPASTEKKIGQAIQKLNAASEKLNAYSTAVTNLGIEPDVFEDVEGRIIVRIGFRNDASIDNIVDWKKSSEEWNHIIRGLALVAGETPEDTKVVGATKGSLILILATTCTVTMLLAMISKHITSIAKHVISVGIMREELRKQKLLTRVIETDLAKQEKKIRDDGIAAINKELAKMIPANADGDAKIALERSISKLLEFGEHGGDIDFVSPPEDETPEGDGDGENANPANEAITEIERVRRLIQEYQEERESVKLLEDKSGD